MYRIIIIKHTNSISKIIILCLMVLRQTVKMCFNGLNRSVNASFWLHPPLGIVQEPQYYKNGQDDIQTRPDKR
jgi:hypothetical protein